MALMRRRHLPRLRIPRVSPAVTVFAVLIVLLLFVSYFSFTAPPLVDRPLLLPDNFGDDELDSDSSSVSGSDSDANFEVPSGGMRSKFGLWGSKTAKNYVGCSNASKKFAAAGVTSRSDRYLMIATSGGLNQQRTGITDAVVAARILNATLVIPKLDQKSFWKDSSNFGEIFDIKWFISFLSKDVKIVKEVPHKLKAISPYNMRVPRKCSPKCYESKVLHVLQKKHVVQLSKFDYRLANRLDTDLQKLRCRANYHALRFTRSIQKMGETLIERMKEKSKHFIALHLRFEPDMLAFSGCYYGGGEKERGILGAIRKRWKTLHKSNPDKERRHGKCPLTPEEIGLMLRALGYGSDIHIYVASGEIYGGEDTLAPLKKLFPNFHSKETLASKEELAPFSPYSNRMAAIDFIVCDGSDAFVTNNNGNMARILAGRRRYFGHKRTIRPNAKKLYSLFLNRANITWEEFASQVRTHQRGFMGDPNEVRPGRGEFHENPSSCICENPDAKRLGSEMQNQSRASIGGRMHDHDAEDIDAEDNRDSAEKEYNEIVDSDYEDELLDRKLAANDTESGLLEEMLSD